MRAIALPLLLLLLTACATGEPIAPPAVSAPDLRGSWTGTWGAQPCALLVTEQAMGPGPSSIMLGSWQLFGDRYPTVVGVLTSTVNGERVSTHVDGRVGQAGGGFVLMLRARAGAGDQRLTLRLVEHDRLQGSGDSQFRWGPQGPAQLTRTP
jgi:hypothetical protein